MSLEGPGDIKVLSKIWNLILSLLLVGGPVATLLDPPSPQINILLSARLFYVSHDNSWFAPPFLRCLYVNILTYIATF